MTSFLKRPKILWRHKMRLVSFFIVVSLFSALPVSSAQDARLEYVKNRLISSGIGTIQVNKLFSDKRLKLFPIKVVAYKPPNWKLIENKFYNDKYVQQGKDYIKMNQAVFEKAEKDYGVSKEALAGVIAIESDFGRYSGNYSVFNVIYSRMKNWPAAKWKGQAGELIALSKLCFKHKLDCYSLKGSYAGAFGIVQFMPSSILAYGVDEDSDGVIDLSKPADAISSAAKYLKAHGWAQNQLKALAGYYGSSVGYPGIVLTYAALLNK